MKEHQRPPAGARCIFLTRNVVAWVDEEDFASLADYRWTVIGKSRYAVRQQIIGWTDDGKRIFGPIIRMHNLIMKPGDGQFVDHKEHVPGVVDNRRSNLRLCSHAQNMGNQKVREGKITSVFKGVYWSKQGIRHWVASIGTSNTNREYLGRFLSEAHAAYAYDLAALKRWGEFARTNFVGDTAVFAS